MTGECIRFLEQISINFIPCPSLLPNYATVLYRLAISPLCMSEMSQLETGTIPTLLTPVNGTIRSRGANNASVIELF